jgi:radical SAM superfamily enzyme YgiQ (UPF0313 family)
MSLHVAFVHTPMAAAVVPEREIFWRNFDVRYHEAHPGLRHMKEPLWELPHWMHWLGGVLLAHGYDSMEVIDLAWCVKDLATLDEPLVLSRVASRPADVYLLSPMTPNLSLALGIAALIKECNPDAKVVFGGVVATPLYEEVAADPHVDYVVIGRGEIALPALLRAIEGKDPVDSVGSLAFRGRDGRVRSSAWRYPSMDPPDIPDPRIDLFPPETGENLRYLRQVYALGCPYGCSFCTIQTIRQKQGFFPVDRVLREIHGYRAQYGEHHNIYFGDETFGIDKPRTRELCAALEADGTVGYDIQTRLRFLADADTRRWLERSGCRWVEVGLETKSQSSQNMHKQRQKVSEVEEVLAAARGDGLHTCSFMVNGFPDQTLDDMKASVEWVCELIARDLLTASYFQSLVPYPGSDLYLRPDDFGIRINHHEYQFYNEDLQPVFDSPHATGEEAYEVFLEGLTMLGQAMRQASGITATEEQITEYGQFWSTSHI